MDSLCGKGRTRHRERCEDSANQEPGLSPSRLNQLLPRREESSALGAPQQGQRAWPPSRNVNYRFFRRLSRLGNPTSVCTLRILLSLIFNPWHFESIKDCDSARLCSFYNGKRKAKGKLSSARDTSLNLVGCLEEKAICSSLYAFIQTNVQPPKPDSSKGCSQVLRKRQVLPFPALASALSDRLQL